MIRLAWPPLISHYNDGRGGSIYSAAPRRLIELSPSRTPHFWHDRRDVKYLHRITCRARGVAFECYVYLRSAFSPPSKKEKARTLSPHTAVLYDELRDIPPTVVFLPPAQKKQSTAPWEAGTEGIPDLLPVLLAPAHFLGRPPPTGRDGLAPRRSNPTKKNPTASSFLYGAPPRRPAGRTRSPRRINQPRPVKAMLPDADGQQPASLGPPAAAAGERERVASMRPHVLVLDGWISRSRSGHQRATGFRDKIKSGLVLADNIHPSLAAAVLLLPTLFPIRAESLKKSRVTEHLNPSAPVCVAKANEPEMALSVQANFRAQNGLVDSAGFLFRMRQVGTRRLSRHRHARATTAAAPRHSLPPDRGCVTACAMLAAVRRAGLVRPRSLGRLAPSLSARGGEPSRGTWGRVYACQPACVLFAGRGRRASTSSARHFGTHHYCARQKALSPFSNDIVWSVGLLLFTALYIIFA
nr:unnamed protein product [Digitaria exilis]